MTEQDYFQILGLAPQNYLTEGTPRFPNTLRLIIDARDAYGRLNSQAKKSANDDEPQSDEDRQKLQNALDILSDTDRATVYLMMIIGGYKEFCAQITAPTMDEILADIRSKLNSYLNGSDTREQTRLSRNIHEQGVRDIVNATIEQHYQQAQGLQSLEYGSQSGADADEENIAQNPPIPDPERDVQPIPSDDSNIAINNADKRTPDEQGSLHNNAPKKGFLQKIDDLMESDYMLLRVLTVVVVIIMFPLGITYAISRYRISNAPKEVDATLPEEIVHNPVLNIGKKRRHVKLPLNLSTIPEEEPNLSGTYWPTTQEPEELSPSEEEHDMPTFADDATRKKAGIAKDPNLGGKST